MLVSPHGFGHATRICAVLESLSRRVDVMPHFFTSVSSQVFKESLDRHVYHCAATDVGFAQNNAFDIDHCKTVAELDSLLPYNDTLVDKMAILCQKMSLVLCDISALGVAVAKRAGVPSVLIENFTWDWLYSFHHETHPGLVKHSRFHQDIYANTDFHIQTTPCCSPKEVDLHCGPIFRRTREHAHLTRRLFCDNSKKLVLITLGGIGFTPSFVDLLSRRTDFFFLFSGMQSDATPCVNVRFLGKDSDYYHPDLINCADLVVFKSGYSTLAECYQSGTPSLCIQREGFAEWQYLNGLRRKK